RVSHHKRGPVAPAEDEDEDEDEIEVDRPAPVGDAKVKMMTMSEAVRGAERDIITRALKATNHNLARSARLLAIDRNTLKRKMDRLSIKRGPVLKGRPLKSRPARSDHDS
ncbi:MAG: helix-turn-helix domain-containing protein, partial [Myxococcota bacterium]